MTKEENENFDSSTKCWICNNTSVEGDVKVRDDCHVRGAAHRDCNINVSLTRKFLSRFTI